MAGHIGVVKVCPIKLSTNIMAYQDAVRMDDLYHACNELVHLAEVEMDKIGQRDEFPLNFMKFTVPDSALGLKITLSAAHRHFYVRGYLSEDSRDCYVFKGDDASVFEPEYVLRVINKGIDSRVADAWTQMASTLSFPNDGKASMVYAIDGENVYKPIR